MEDSVEEYVPMPSANASVSASEEMTLETDCGLKYSGFVDAGYSGKRMRENISQFSLSSL